MPSLVAADVPDEAPLARVHDLAHELFLARGVGLVVGRRRAVAGPLGRARLPLEPAHELVEALHVGDDQLLLEAGALQLALHVALRVVVLALEPGVQRDVRHHATAEEVTERHEPPRLDRRDPFEAAAEPRPEVHSLVRLQQQRIEIEHAELAVAGPRLTRPQPLERADVDEDRSRAAPLDVVRGRILEHQVLVERAAKQLELQQRRIAQHRERPLVRIRDEGNALVLEDGGRVGDRRFVDARRRDELALCDGLPRRASTPTARSSRAGRPRKARAGRARRRRRRDCPSREKTPARVKSPRRAAQRFPAGSRTGSSASLSCEADIGSDGASSSGLRMCRISRKRRHHIFNATATAAAPPRMIWRSMLPLAASM